MEGRNFGNQNEGLEFRQIVLAHLKRILELSSHELRDSTRHISHANFTDIVESEDTRISYIQSVENLSYVLVPHFDDQIKKVYEKCIKIITALDYEVRDLCDQEYTKICSDIGKESLEKERWRSFIIEMKIRSAKKLFVALNLLLKRNDYLKSSIFGETRDEVIEDVEDD
jgi:hypothetical protein